MIKLFFIISFFLYMKMLTEYYKKTSLSKKAWERYRHLSEEEKNKKCQYASKQYRKLSEEEKIKKRQYGRERYENLLEDKKQRLVEYIKG